MKLKFNCFWCKRKSLSSRPNPRFCKRCQKRLPKKEGRELTRTLVRIRDNFTCQDCGKRRLPKDIAGTHKRLFDVHHLNGLCGKRSRSYDKVSEIDGLITLCHKCHFNRPEHVSKKIDEKLIKRNEAVVKYIKQGHNFSEAAQEFGFTRQRAQQIYKKVIHM